MIATGNMKVGKKMSSGSSIDWLGLSGPTRQFQRLFPFLFLSSLGLHVPAAIRNAIEIDPGHDSADGVMDATAAYPNIVQAQPPASSWSCIMATIMVVVVVVVLMRCTICAVAVGDWGRRGGYLTRGISISMPNEGLYRAVEAVPIDWAPGRRNGLWLHPLAIDRPIE